MEWSERSDGRPLLPPPRGLPPCCFLILVCLVMRCPLWFFLLTAPFWLLAPLCGCARGRDLKPALSSTAWSLRKRMPPWSVRGGCGVLACACCCCGELGTAGRRCRRSEGGAAGSVVSSVRGVGECAAELGGSRGLELGECVCYLSFRFACFGGLGPGARLAVRRRACL